MKTKEQIDWIKQRGSERQKELLLPILEKLLQQEEAMTKEEILSYAKKIKPVMRGTAEYVAISPEIEKKDIFWIPAFPISTQSFSYSCEAPIKPAVGLKEIGRITTYHRYGGYRAFLRPSTDEAIIQCPKDILDKVCAFEFQTETMEYSKIYHAGLDRHILTTVYYEGTLPEDIAAQDVSW